MQTISLTVDADGIAAATIDVPGRSMNVLAPAFTDDLATLLAEVTTRPDIRSLLLTSGKPGEFVAGADIEDLARAYDEGWTAADGARHSQELQRLLRALETCGKPVAAAMNGLALGVGLELALACHYRVLVDDPKAVVGLPEVSLGLLPWAGGTQRLPRLIGIERALPLMLSGNPIKPEEALRLGVVDAVVARDQVLDTARRWLTGSPCAVQPWDEKGYRIPGGAGCLAPHAVQSFHVGTAAVRARTAGNLPAPKAILSAVFEGTQVPITTGLAIESKYFGALLAHPVSRNLMRTTFLSKGAADRLARRPAGIPPSRVRTLGVLGAGAMGAGIAHCAAGAGIEVVLLDRDQATAERGRDYARRLLGQAVERGVVTADVMQAQLDRIRPTTRFQDLAGCDFVVEAVFEDRAIKADVTAQAEAAIPPGTIVASNTSTLTIASLAARSRRPAQFIGLHFFSPVERMPLVEVIVGPQTSAATLARALDLVALLRKTPIVVHDGPAFFTTRVFCAYIDEGMQMLADGIEPALIENAARLAGMTIGPLAVTDETTQALRWQVVQQAVADGLPDRFTQPAGLSVLRVLCERLNRRGRRHGGGFYEYPEKGRKYLWPGLSEHFPPASRQPDVEIVKQRLLYIQALEAARCLEEGVLTEPADGDLGSVLGIGYPPWTGGVLSFIDTVGIATFVAGCERLAAAAGLRFAPSPWLRARAGQGTSFYPGARAIQG
jgi:3-hydroxyacyl-CoA dehydrogenase/enoyl-CoA hydratase/3-hydroxybutyryl-CoA epimerase